ncbi:MAG: NAD(P)-binding protein [Phormidesmis sp. RL_2_1]|nr:NAD(P)-binding protein [Phormidesmis sp. RL_2_1]
MKKHIAIAGAGPAGAATALLLARQGHRVTLIEQNIAFERVFRGEGLMPAGVAALHQMGLSEILASIPSRQLDAWDFYVGGQRRMRVMEPKNAGLATHIVDQGALLGAMIEQAQPLPNFEFYPGWQVTGLLTDRSERINGIRATAQGHQTQNFFADVVIACDGRYSRLRKLAKLPMAHASAQFDVLWFKLPAPASLARETPFVACLQPDRQFAFYPSWDGRLQIGWIVEKKSHPLGGLAQLNTLNQSDWIEAFAPALPPELAAHFRQHQNELEGPIYLNVQVGCCPQWSLPGLLLIGDAAHPMAPNRAQGINMALRDAIVVANHFAAAAAAPQAAGQAVEETMPMETLLQAIQAERQPEIEAVQKMQLAEWRKVEFISRPGLPYLGFKAIASLFGRFQFAQNIWLHEQQGLREGVVPVQLKP